MVNCDDKRQKNVSLYLEVTYLIITSNIGKFMNFHSSHVFWYRTEIDFEMSSVTFISSNICDASQQKVGQAYLKIKINRQQSFAHNLQK